MFLGPRIGTRPMRNPWSRPSPVAVIRTTLGLVGVVVVGGVYGFLLLMGALYSAVAF